MRTSRIHAPRSLLLGLLAVGLIGAQAGTVAAVDPTTTLVPIGSDYQQDTLQLFAREAAARNGDGVVHILVLPITYSLDAFTTTKSERKKNLTLADNRRGQVETACNAVAAGKTCTVELVPALVRSDAYLASNLAYFTPDVDGIYVLGGDQTVAMNLVAETPLETAMSDAFTAGAVFGGNSAGAAVQSIDMINGYTNGNGPAESMRQGAVELCTPAPTSTCERGLIFGFDNLITDQHVFEYGRMGRSLNIALQSGKPVLGADAATGAVVTNETDLRDVTGDTAVYVIDPDTYGAAVNWAGPNDTLSARNVAFHLLPVGDFGFSFDAMAPRFGGTSYGAPANPDVAYPAFTTGDGAAALFLSGGIVADPAGRVGQAFVAAANGTAAKIVVLSAGYEKNAKAQADAKAIAAALAPSVASVQWFALGGNTRTADVLAALDGATGVVLTGSDRSRIGAALAAEAEVLGAIKAAWLAGSTTVLADDAAAAAMGTRFVAQGNVADVEAGAIEDILGVSLGDGLGWVRNLDVEPRLLPDQHWPQLLQLTTESVDDPAVGIDVGTAVVVRDGTAHVVGDSAAVVLDASQAHVTTAPGRSPAFAWLLLDSFVDGDTVAQ